jgi:hypothetical protein
MIRCFLLLFAGALVFGQPSEAPAATAKIHVYRLKRKFGFALNPSIYLDGVELKRLHNGDLLVSPVPLGKHLITAGRSEVGLLIDFQPGVDYFFRFSFRSWGSTAFGAPPVVLTQVLADVATSEMKGLKPYKEK